MDRWVKVVRSRSSCPGQVAADITQYGVRLKVIGHRTDHDVAGVYLPNLFPPLSHFSSSAPWFIQVWDGTEGLTQPAARQRPYSALSIIQIPYLPWVLWDHHNAMSPSQKSIHMLRKMLFCKWKRCLTDAAQTRVIYTEHTHTHRIPVTHTQKEEEELLCLHLGFFVLMGFWREFSVVHQKTRTHSLCLLVLTWRCSHCLLLSPCIL